MLFPRVNREDAEKIFTVIHNVDGTTVTTGMGVRYAGGLPAEDVSADGISAVKITSVTFMPVFAGIAKRDIPSDDYGIVQCWGAVDSVLLSHVGTSITVGTVGGVVNTYLQPSPIAGVFTSALNMHLTVAIPYKKLNIFNSSETISAAGYCKGFVRAL